MTPLREQLQEARSAYQSATYPGDLAAELLPVRRGGGWRLLPAILAGALAASVVVVVMIGNHGIDADPIASPSGPSIALTPQPSTEYIFPDRMPLTLPASPLLPAMPPVNVSFAELNLLGQQQYEQLGPKLRQLWPGWAGSRHDGERPATQQAV